MARSFPKRARAGQPLRFGPNFAKLPTGAPSIPLSKIQAVLTGPNGERLTVEAKFIDGVATLEFDVPITGASATFQLNYTAFDLQGVVAFTGTQTLTLRPGKNASVPAPTLVYDASGRQSHSAPHHPRQRHDQGRRGCSLSGHLARWRTASRSRRASRGRRPMQRSSPSALTVSSPPAARRVQPQSPPPRWARRRSRRRPRSKFRRPSTRSRSRRPRPRSFAVKHRTRRLTFATRPTPSSTIARRSMRRVIRPSRRFHRWA